MTAQVCPPFDQLRAFGLGAKLDPATDESIAAHLNGCDTCASAVATLPGDEFLVRRRAIEKMTDAASQASLGTPASSSEATPKPNSASPLVDDVPPELSRDPEYEVLSELGRGGMGVVYLVKNRLMDRLEAVKVLSTGFAAQSGASERFLQEIRSAAQLTHRYVVQAYSARQVGSVLMLTMEYLPDGDLRTLVNARGPLPITNACYFAWQVATALQHAHEKGMVHRDIKPSNLLLVRNGKRQTVKVTDFGLAKARKATNDAGLTSTGEIMGTPHYMAPEQARDAASVDIRADIYSLGCTLYFLLTGKTPFTGAQVEVLWKHREEQPQLIIELRPDVPEPLAAIIEKMMAKDPVDRYQTPAEVAKALSPLIKKSAAGESVPPDRTPAAPGPVSGGSPSIPPVSAKPVEALRALSDRHGAESLKRFRARAQTPPRPSWIMPAILAGVLLVGVFAAWGLGALSVKTNDGVIVFDGLPADAEVLVDGKVVTVTWNGEEATATLTQGGPHKLKLVQAGTQIFSSDVTVTLGGEPVRIHVEPLPIGGNEPVAEPTASDRAAALPTEAPELLVNPGCEEPAISGRIPAWEVIAGGWHQCRTDWAQEGKAFFGADDCGHAVIMQQVDVSRYAASIDAGGQAFAFQCSIHTFNQGRGVRSDSCRISVQFLNAEASLIPDSEYDSGERASPGKWRELSGIRTAPVGTRWIRVRLSSHRNTGKANNGYFDALSLKAMPPKADPSTAADNFVPLFNGKDLTGWSGDPNVWSIRDGDLVARRNDGQILSLLKSQRRYKDFEIKFEIRAPGTHTGGVGFRREPGDGMGKGPIVMAGASAWGALYARSVGKRHEYYFPPDDSVKTRADVKPRQFNEIYLRCVGKRVTIKVNGVTTADGEVQPLAEDGILVFQIYGSDAGEIVYRNARIRELDPKSAPEPSTPAIPTGDFVPLFNGHDLTGWNGDPNVWSLRDGDLVAQNHGGRILSLLQSERSYKDFEIRCEVLVRGKTGGGIGFRRVDFGRPATDGRGLSVSAGGAMWGELVARTVGKPPEHFFPTDDSVKARMDIRPDGFNVIYIRCVGQHVTAKVNGVTTADGEVGILAADGTLIFQLYGSDAGEIVYRNAQIRELGSSNAPELSTKAISRGEFVPLFNGTDLTEWNADSNVWSIRDGDVVARNNGGRILSLLGSKQSYKNFEIRCQVLVSGNVAGGIAFRATALGRQATDGRGLSVNAGGASWGELVARSVGKPIEYFFPPDDSVKARLGIRPDGFNAIYIRCVGQHVTVKVNGVTTAEGEVGILAANGSLVFQIYGSDAGEIVYRNARIRELPAPMNDDPQSN